MKQNFYEAFGSEYLQRTQGAKKQDHRVYRDIFDYLQELKAHMHTVTVQEITEVETQIAELNKPDKQEYLRNELLRILQNS